MIFNHILYQKNNVVDQSPLFIEWLNQSLTSIQVNALKIGKSVFVG
jgi:hypothetical protein